MRGFFAGLLLTAAASGAVVYDNTLPTGAVTGFCNQCVNLDDVLIPIARDPLRAPIAITSITIGIDAAPGANGVFQPLNFYSFGVLSDGTPAKNPTLIGEATPTVTGIQNVTLGNGVTPLITVQPDFVSQPGFGLLYIGMEGQVGWQWANGPDANLPTAWLYHLDTGDLFLDTSSPPFPPNLSYDMRIEGTALPEPAYWAVIGGVLAACVIRRIRQA